jgi:hypothetical protein
VCVVNPLAAVVPWFSTVAKPLPRIEKGSCAMAQNSPKGNWLTNWNIPPQTISSAQVINGSNIYPPAYGDLEWVGFMVFFGTGITGTPSAKFIIESTPPETDWQQIQDPKGNAAEFDTWELADNDQRTIWVHRTLLTGNYVRMKLTITAGGGINLPLAGVVMLNNPKRVLDPGQSLPVILFDETRFKAFHG